MRIHPRNTQIGKLHQICFVVTIGIVVLCCGANGRQSRRLRQHGRIHQGLNFGRRVGPLRVGCQNFGIDHVQIVLRHPMHTRVGIVLHRQWGRLDTVTVVEGFDFGQGQLHGAGLSRTTTTTTTTYAPRQSTRSCGHPRIDAHIAHRCTIGPRQLICTKDGIQPLLCFDQ